MNRFHVRMGGRDFQAELFSLLREVQDVRHVEQRLRRHAAPENTQAAELTRTIDDRGFETAVDGDARGVEARTAATYHEKIVRFHAEKRIATSGARAAEIPLNR